MEAANAIYRGLARFIATCQSRGIHWCIENPADSLMWELPPIKALFEYGHLVKFQLCMFGGQRPTWKGFLTTVPQVQSMAVSCNGGHSHVSHERTKQPDGTMRYPTSEDAAYPRPLCLQLVKHVCSALSVPFVANPEVHNASPAVALAASAGRMPRGRKVPPLVPEYKHIATMPLNELPQVDHKRCLLAALPGVPAGSKLLSHSPCNGGESHASSNVVQCTFGIFFTQQEFLARATKCLHPADSLCAIDDDAKRVMFDTLTKGPAWVASHRAQTLKRWSEWASELERAEKDLHQQLEQGVRSVLKGKRLLLLQRIAEDINWPDKTLFDELKQ